MGKTVRACARFALILALVVSGLLCSRTRTNAMPYFSYQYGYTCTACHTTMPQLTPFGAAFRNAGYRFPQNTPAHAAVPIGFQAAVASTTAADPTGLPHTIVDYLTLNSDGPAGRGFDYSAELYVVDGGRPGAMQTAYLEYSSMLANPDAAHDFRLKAGEFYLPLPVSQEVFRETLGHYAAFDQTVGLNPFNLFNPRDGIDASIGGQYGGSSLHLIVTQGHDFQSGIPSSSPDVMVYGEHDGKVLTVAGYAVEGSRNVGGPVDDQFERGAAALIAKHGRAELDTLLQNGWDSSSDGLGAGEHSSAGFSQFRWSFSPGITAITREDLASADGQLTRTTTASLELRPRPNCKLVLESQLGTVGKPVESAELFVAY